MLTYWQGVGQAELENDLKILAFKKLLKILFSKLLSAFPCSNEAHFTKMD